ncbi:MAG: hypothetical protein H6668_01780 [Ardenticatenaceae bacterium]|nr:hypothetical protein [Ardenticatenaceae bacterium]
MSEQITITLSNEIYQQIAQQATLNRQNISDVVHDVVVRTFTPQNSPVNPARDKMLQEVEAYKKLHPVLVKTHLGQFVAIFQGQLVDSDPDKQTLFFRIKENFPNQIVLQRQVLLEVDPVFGS